MAIDPNLLMALLSQVPQVGPDDESDRSIKPSPWVPPPSPSGRLPGPDDLDQLRRLGIDPRDAIIIPHNPDIFDQGETGGDLEGLVPGRSSVPSDFFGGRPGLDRKVGEEWVPRLPSRQPLEWTHTNQGGWYDPTDNYPPYAATDYAQYGTEGPFAPHWGASRDLQDLMGISRTTWNQGPGPHSHRENIQAMKGHGPPGAGWHEKQYLAGPEHEYERRKYNDEGMARVRRSARREELRNDPELLRKSISWSPEQLEEYLNWRPASYDLLDRTNRWQDGSTNEQRPETDLNKMQTRKWKYGGKDVRVEWVNGKPTVISVVGGRDGEVKEPGRPGPLPRIPRGLETLF